MTELTITPKTADKTARFKGAVAAGEHVAVIIKGGAAWIDNEDAGAHLSLRVLDLVTGRTLAVFPRPPETLLEGESFAEGENEWAPSEENPEDLYCELNLNTVPMVAAARHMLRVPVLFVLGEKDDEDASVVRTLYFRDRHVVEYWPERIGDDTPYDLDKWPRQIDEWTDLITEWTEQFSKMKVQATPMEDGMLVTVWDGTGEEPEPVEIKNGQDGAPGEVQFTDLNERCVLLAGGTESESPTNVMTGQINFPISGGNQSIVSGSGGVTVTDGTKSYEFTASGNSTGNNTVARLSDVATKQNTLTFDSAPTANSTNPVTSGGVKTAIDAVAGDVADINDLIPSAASSSNQIADKAFVNSSIATNTANYISDNGEPFESVTALNAYSGTKTNNDYAFVVGKDSDGNTTYTRYKWNGSQWAAEYVLNNSSFTAAQWAAISSGITENGVSKLAGIEAGAQVNVIETVKVNGTALTPSGKAVNIQFIETQADWNETSSTSPSFIRNKPTIPEPLPVYSDDPLPDGTASPGTGTAYALGNHRHPTDTTRQASITASGILKGNGSGGVTSAVAGTDYQAPLTIDATPTASSTNPVQSGGVKTALDGKLSTTGDTRTVTAEDSGGTETYKFAGTGETTDANAIVRVGGLPYANVGEASQILVGVYGILSRGVQRHTATSGETSATFGFADAPGTGKIADAILDIDNSGNTSALGLEFSGLGTAFVLVPPDGDDLAEMTSVDGGKQARFYFTETALVSNNLPVISIQRITLGAVATAITRGS